ncbi:hypothetical protein ACT8ZR_15775 [Neobacillus sp. M.A.Huq-85]
MNEKEKLGYLIAYLQALAEISQKSEVKVFSEIKRVIKEIEELIKK